MKGWGLFCCLAQEHWGQHGPIRPRSGCDLPGVGTEQRPTGERWRSYREALGLLGCGVDLVLQGQNDAAKLAGSRWHVMKDVARHGVVLCASL